MRGLIRASINPHVMAGAPFAAGSDQPHRNVQMVSTRPE